jgi:hypothetical protein
LERSEKSIKKRAATIALYFSNQTPHHFLSMMKHASTYGMTYSIREAAKIYSDNKRLNSEQSKVVFYVGPSQHD